MGMFFLTRNDIKATDVFPKNLPTKICADFTCKGRECTRASCPYSHPRNAHELPADTIAAIACHFSTKKIGWLNEWHFMKLAHLPPNVNALVGGKDGPSSSKRA
jgi:hypothetical protein